MSTVTTEDVQTLVRSFVIEKLEQQGRELETELTPESDLLLDGIIDSMGMLELTALVQDEYQRDLDFEDLDPERMTVVGAFCDYIAAQLSGA